MSDDLTVSVIIPVYNGESFLAEALQSVLNQTLSPDEIIVVDDGSTDQSAQVVASLAASVALPIRYLHQENKGPAAARNRGIEQAHGDVIAFLDADDLWDRHKLEIQLPRLKSNPECEVVWGRLQVFTKNKESAMVKSETQQMPNVGCVLFRRSAFGRVGLFNETMRWSEDMDWFVRARECGLPIATHPDVVLWYRYHANNSWLGRPDSHLATLSAVKKRLERRRP